MPVVEKRGRVLSIQVGRVRDLSPLDGGEAVAVRSAFAKQPVSTLAAPQPVAVARLGLFGDEQADPEAHGGLEKAIYVYPREHYAHWQAFLGRAEALPGGALGENLTIEGVVESDLWIGDTLQIGDGRYVVSRPRRPCHKLNTYLGHRGVGREMLLHGITGWYLAVDTPAEMRAGDAVTVLPGSRQVSLAERVRQITRPVDLD